MCVCALIYSRDRSIWRSVSKCFKWSVVSDVGESDPIYMYLYSWIPYQNCPACTGSAGKRKDLINGKRFY